MMLEFRNPIYNALGTIDIEINHPDYGWIPFTADPDDVEQLGKDIYAAAVAGEVAPYVEPESVIVIPDRVSSRQFKMQLEISGLTSAVEGWVSSQSTLIQIGYNNSGTFVRDDPMMIAGFTALSFTEEQVNDFFLAASLL